MGVIASQITSLTIVYSVVYSGADQRKQQSSASLAFVRGFTVTGEFPAQMAGNAENVSIWWRHHEGSMLWSDLPDILKILAHSVYSKAGIVSPLNEISLKYMGQYQIVVHFGYGSTMKYFVGICVFSLIQLKGKCLSFPKWHICKLNISILSCGSIFITRIYE